MRKFILFLAALCCCAMMNVWASLPSGALPGTFTINAQGKKVYFSKGDLMYQPSTGTWRFMDAYETRQIDNSVRFNRETTDKWLNLFGWGASGYVNTVSSYPTAQPTSVHTYSLGPVQGIYGSIDGNDLAGVNAEYDWAWHNKIENGGNQEHLWRTLSIDEWLYIVNSRSEAYKKRFWVALQYQDSNIPLGLILLPDQWDRTDLFDNTSLTVANEYEYFNMTLQQITDIVEAGGVLLNTAGMRQVYNLEEKISGFYWSVTKDGSRAKALYFVNRECGGINYVLCGQEMTTATTDVFAGLRVRPVIDKDTADQYHAPTEIPVTHQYFDKRGNIPSAALLYREEGYYLFDGAVRWFDSPGTYHYYIDIFYEDWYCDHIALVYETGKPTDVINVGKGVTEVDIPISEPCEIQVYVYEYNYFGVRAEPNDTTMGTTTGTGRYMEGTKVTLTATPAEGYLFVNWTYNGNLNNLTVYGQPVTSPATFTDQIITLRSEGEYGHGRFTANFAPIPPKYTLSVQANVNQWGTVSGGGTVEAGQTVTVTATPNPGCQFIGWETEDREWIYKYTTTRTVYKDEVLTAHFRQKPDYQVYPLKVCGVQVTELNKDNLQNGAMRYDPETNRLTVLRSLNLQLSGANTFITYSGSEELILAIDSALSVEYTLGSSVDYAISSLAGISIEAEREGNYLRDFSLTCFNAPAIYVQGKLSIIGRMRAGIYGKGTAATRYNIINGNLSQLYVSQAEVTISDSGSPQKKVSYESDNTKLQLNKCELNYGGLNQNSIYIVSTVPQFEVSYTNERPYDEWMDICPVMGMGYYLEYSYAVLTATPQEGYAFVSWADGVTDNPRKIWITDENYYIDPVCVVTHTPGAFVSAHVDNPDGGAITGFTNDWYKAGIHLTMTVQVNEGFEFIGWADGDTSNPRYITVEDGNNLDLTAILMDYRNVLPQDGSGNVTVYCIVAMPDNEQNGTVSGAEQRWYEANQQLTITAVAANGYKFKEWNDGIIDNPRTVTVTEDKLYVATFVLSEGIEFTNDELQITNKFLKDGVLLIERNGKTYNALGAEVQ